MFTNNTLIIGYVIAALVVDVLYDELGSVLAREYGVKNELQVKQRIYQELLGSEVTSGS